MTYSERKDGRKFEELRPIEAKAGVIKNADGSAYFRIGNTFAYAAVYGPRDLYPKFKQDPTRGVLRCHYNMMPFAGMGDRVRPGSNRRSKEISMVSENAIVSVVDLSAVPGTVIDVFIELPQTDAGSRCAGITAASIALADAGIPMKDMVAAAAVGKVDDKIVADLDYYEEAYPAEVADIPVAMIPSTEQITLLQMDGMIEKDQLMEALELSKVVLKKINELQRKALKDKYGGQK